MTENIEEARIIQIAKKVCFSSTGVGTLLLVAFVITKASALIPIGLCYLLAAVIINSVFVLFLIIECLSNLIQWRKYLATILLMLGNVPLSITYCYIAMNVTI